MNTENRTPLEHELATLTKWSGEMPELWRGAIGVNSEARAIAAPTVRRNPIRRLLTRRFATVAAAAIGILFLLPMLNYLGRGFANQYMEARHASPQSIETTLSETQSPADEAALKAKVYSNDNVEFTTPLYSAKAPEDIGGGRAARRVDSLGYGGGSSESAAPAPQIPQTAEGRGGERLSDSRHVIRKATIELRTRDVRAASAKAALLVSEAGGEFVQESTLSGHEDRLQANLTLRVAADRLSTVLNELRGLGEVRSEAAGGEDVTTQVVDLEARLKNERRVEQELLQLLETRKDSPLKEILELRTAIGSVRQSIETMTAQRERLSRLVSLATVLVLIRTPDAPDKPAEEGLARYLATSLQRAALRGVRALIDTLAGLTLVLIGGGIWILLAALAAWFGWRALRRQTPGE